MIAQLVFSLETNRGVAANRAPVAGEYSRPVDVELIGDFFNTPSRYQWTGTALIEYPGWAAEQAEKALEELQVKARAAIIAEEDRQSWKPIEHPNFSGVFHKATDAIARTTKRFRNLADNEPFPLNGGSWRDFEGNPVLMTMGELRALEDALFDRAAHNDGVAQYHIGEMLKLADPTTYDYSGGWA